MNNHERGTKRRAADSQWHTSEPPADSRTALKPPVERLSQESRVGYGESSQSVLSPTKMPAISPMSSTTDIHSNPKSPGVSSSGPLDPTVHPLSDNSLLSNPHASYPTSDPNPSFEPKVSRPIYDLRSFPSYYYWLWCLTQSTGLQDIRSSLDASRPVRARRTESRRSSLGARTVHREHGT